MDQRPSPRTPRLRSTVPFAVRTAVVLLAGLGAAFTRGAGGIVARSAAGLPVVR